MLTAYEDNASLLSDTELLDRAMSLERVLFTQDEDLLTIAAARQSIGLPFAGVIYGYQLRTTIGQCIHDLELIALAEEPEDLMSRVEYLPL